MISWISVFAVMVLLDWLWADYTASIARERPHRAAGMAVGIILFSGFVTTSYVHDPWLLIPAGLGAYAGTWACVKWGKR